VRWLAFGTYDVQAHPRVAVLLEGLVDHGQIVEEVVHPLGLSTAARVRLVQQPWRLPLAAARLLRCWARLVRDAGPLLMTPPAYDAVLVGYLGHLDVLLARLLITVGRARRPRQGRPVLVLDHLVSAAGTAGDRGLASPGGLKHRALRALDAAALWAADVVLVDTEQRLTELTERGRRRAVVVPVGATREWFIAGAAHTAGSEPMRAIFVGLFTPLQGTLTIAEALTRAPCLATLAGSGQDLAASRQIVGSAPGVTWIDWVPAAELPALVSSFDVGLGIFGTTPKALSVVPTKVFQAAAAGCAVVTSDTVPQRVSLGDAAIFVPPGDPQALADALSALAADRSEVERLGAAAFARAQAEFTAHAVVSPMIERVTRESR
jgi:glycosyltransferase involved in cell wall biosynthesis